jgi:hypothetical protein
LPRYGLRADFPGNGRVKLYRDEALIPPDNNMNNMNEETDTMNEETANEESDIDEVTYPKFSTS